MNVTVVFFCLVYFFLFFFYLIIESKFEVRHIISLPLKVLRYCSDLGPEPPLTYPSYKPLLQTPLTNLSYKPLLQTPLTYRGFCVKTT